MGIKQLNYFLMENCSAKSIYKASLRQFANKTLVIDTSIYLYKFAEKDAVAENMYLMISVLRQHNITPVFVFDGKPPPEKKALLIKRKLEKDAAEEKYNALKIEAESGTVSAKMLHEMDALKRQFVRVSDTDIAKSKEIMTAYGVPYIESRGESDHLCAFLVRHGFAWACVSDDMDMFLYGCPRVIRHLSLLNHEGIYYDMESILAELEMTQTIFNDIAILSGTDYNMKEQKSLGATVRLYVEYRKWAYYSRDPKTFYEWLLETTDYIDDVGSLEKVRKMFDLELYLENHREEFKTIVDAMPFRSKPVETESLQEILKSDGFIFA
jgi:flap endonuclease-1